MYIVGPDPETGEVVQRQVKRVINITDDGRYTCLMADGGIEGGVNQGEIPLYDDAGAEVAPEVSPIGNDAELMSALQILLGGE
jgi:hypothetical protein